MIEDPVVAEVRKRRKELMAKYNFDLDAIGKMLEELNEKYIPRIKLKHRIKQAA
jgi:hypothetical protein